MDRLEKALEKARAQRSQALSPQEESPAASAEAAVHVSDMPPPEPVVNKVSTRQITVVEENLDRNRIVARRKRDATADIFRMLRTKVLQHISKNNVRTLAITSPNYGDGKTTIATNLALSLAQDVKQTVLLVDLDLRKPEMHNRLGIEPTVGLTDYLLRDARVPDCMVKPDVERLVLLPTSGAIDNSSEMLATPKMAALAHELKTRYADRIVIYDMPPLLTQDDTIAFLPNVDGVLLVVRDGVTKTEDLEYCLHLLEHTNLLGTVLNNSQERVGKRY